MGEERLTFEKDVRPIFKAYCLDCHGGESLKGKLDLRLKRFAEKGGESGPAIVAGERRRELPAGPARATARCRRARRKCRPSRSRSSERWIATGAATLHDEPETLPPGIDITPEERGLLGVSADPAARAARASAGGDGVRTPIDGFVLAKLREQRAVVRSRGRPADLDPPGQRRPDRAPAVARGDRRLLSPTRVQTPTSD